MFRRLFCHPRTLPRLSFAIALLAVLVTALVLLVPQVYAELVLAHPDTRPWQYLTGVFVHGTEEGGPALALVHLFANLLLFLPYAVPVENALGRGKFFIVFFSSLFVNDLSFKLMADRLVQTAEETATGAGLSGIAFTFIVLGTYLIGKLCAMDFKKARKNPLTYLFAAGFVGQLFIFNPRLAGTASLVIHLAGVITGVLFLFVFKRDLDRFLRAQ